MAATTMTYDITTVWTEPDTAPRDSIFVGSFDYDPDTRTVSNLQGKLSESMTGEADAYPDDSMVWLDLDHQLETWYDTELGGTFAATFLNDTVDTFDSTGEDTWSPQAGVTAQGIHYGHSTGTENPGNAYALIFIPEDPTAALTQDQIDTLAYADCVPTHEDGMSAGGGMMGKYCMTGTSAAAHGTVGTMHGYPTSQQITAADSNDPETPAASGSSLSSS
ncbi:PEP-CTERM sorting domain-containing protein [Corynebacterium alimapuense]|uniref:PEP-CTERM sorting domain-containing protein n=2 Tax=Corynebacterium alimapuense TaxID=1576874 RepID=A0A3M8KB65_9CORY|nr:PEP-CTERM sorting domain-containing protein [Corynebacterium alimapuense]